MLQRTSGILSQSAGRFVLAAVIMVLIGAFAASRFPKVESSAPGQPPIGDASVEHVSVASKPKSISLRAEPRSQGVPLEATPNTSESVVSPAKSRSLAAPQIARTAHVSLFVRSVEGAVKSLSQLAHRENGDILSMEVRNQSTSTAKASADIGLRVSANRFEDSMGALDKIGKVRQRSVSAEDLTGDITDSAARLRNLRRTESDIRRIMDRSGTVGQVLEAENQLSQVREQIETLESYLKSMNERVVYSTISINLEAEASTAPVERTAIAQLASAWHAALHALSQLTVGFIAVLLWLVVFAPYLLVAALGSLIYAQLQKRMRARVSE